MGLRWIGGAGIEVVWWCWDCGGFVLLGLRWFGGGVWIEVDWCCWD